VRRRFGNEALERVAQPLIGGIYASDPEKLSLAATMPRFRDMEQKQRSVIRAMWSEQKVRARSRETGSGARWSLFVTLADGMQELVEALIKKLPEGALRLNAPAANLIWNGDANRWRVAAGGEMLDADAVIVAAPAFQTARLISSFSPDAASELERISYASTATVNLAYRRADFPSTPDSFGFVVPAAERRKIMACTFSSLKYPGRAPQDHVLLRAFVGGALQPELFRDDDEKMVRNVRGELASLLALHAEPVFSRVRRHPDSMPQYHVGHQARIARIEASCSRFPSLAVAGSAYHGVGISDCVRTGEESAEKIIGILSV